MPLLIDLKPGERVIINGSVLENAGSNTKIRIHNESAILRQKEILTEQDAVTPASRVYFALQCAYIFPDRRAHYLELFHGYLGEYLEACPSAAPIGDEIRGAIETAHYYAALRACRKLLRHEADVVASMTVSPPGEANG